MMITLIPAKAVSARVPGKNFRPFFEKQCLVDLAAELAASANCKSPIIISTDNYDYKNQNPAIIVHQRAANLSTYSSPIHATLIDIANHASLGDEDYILLMQPTSPFRRPSELNEFIMQAERLKKRAEAFSLISIYKVVDAHPARMYSQGPGGRLLPFIDAHSTLQSQELPACYHRNGCFYMLSVKDIRSGRLYSDSIYGFQMPYQSSINIDTIEDFNIAATMYPIFAAKKLDSLQ